MNPSSNETPGLNLPAPVSEQAPMQGANPVEAYGANSPEAQLNGPMPPAGYQPAVAPQGFAPIAATPDPLAVINDASSTTDSVVPAATHDSDLIDKHIVDRAKAIIDKTRDDPYKQSEELTVFKAEHLDKNYNRQIKTKSNK